MGRPVVKRFSPAAADGQSPKRSMAAYAGIAHVTADRRIPDSPLWMIGRTPVPESTIMLIARDRQPLFGVADAETMVCVLYPSSFIEFLFR